MYENDNIILNLKEPYKNKSDDVKLNLGTGEAEGIVLSGVIVPPITLNMVLEGVISERSFELSGTITVPTSSVSVTGKVYRLFSLAGVVRPPTTVVRMSGRLGTMYYGTGVIIAPAPSVSLSGNIREVHTYDAVGGITVPNYPISVFGLLIQKKPVFRGVSGGFTNSWSNAVSANTKPDEIPFDKSLFRKQGVSLPWHKGLVIGTVDSIMYHKAILQYSSDVGGWYKGLPITPKEYRADYRGTTKYRTILDSAFHEAAKLKLPWMVVGFEELSRLRTGIRFQVNEGSTAYKALDSNYDLGAKRYRSWLMPWSQATRFTRQDFDRTKPWIPPKPPTYQGSTDLNLLCTYKGKRDNIYLNLDVCRCFQTKYVPTQDVYTVLNEIKVTREFDQKEIHPSRISISTDRDSWCWSVSMSVAGDQINNLIAIAGELPLIRIVLNGRHFVFLLEGKNRSRKFGDKSYTVTGRSATALLSDPHAAVRTYTQPALMSSVQLIAQELSRVSGVEFEQSWEGLVGDNGWLLPESTLSYTGLTPIKAIQELITPVGGVVVSHPSLPKIHIKPRNPFGHWQTPDIKLSVPENILQDDGTEWVQTPYANGVWVYSGSTELAAKVDREGTEGELLAGQITSRVFTDGPSLREAGRAVLIQSNPNETTSMTSAFHDELGIPPLAEVMEITSDEGSWWATVDSIDIEVAVQGEVPTIGLKVGVQRFMSEAEVIL